MPIIPKYVFPEPKTGDAIGTGDVLRNLDVGWDPAHPRGAQQQFPDRMPKGAGDTWLKTYPAVAFTEARHNRSVVSRVRKRHLVIRS